MIFTSILIFGLVSSVQSISNSSELPAASVGHPLLFHKSNDGKHYAEFIRYDVDRPVTIKPTWDYLKVDPIASKQPSTFGQKTRTPRSEEYDSYEKGYQDFLMNYHKDNDSYKVKEEEQEGEEDEDDNDDSDGDDIGRNDDEDGESGSTSENNSGSEEDNDSESEEKYHKPKKSYKSKGKKNKSDESDKDYDRVKQEANKKKSKHCKTEKRGNMLCNVCYNPKNEESSEQCSFSSDPNDKKYAYSKGKKYNSKDGDNKREDPEQKIELTTHRPPTYYIRQKHPRPPNYRNYRQHYVPYGTPRYQIYRPVTAPVMILRPTQRYYPRKPRSNPYLPRYTHVAEESRLHRDIVGFDLDRPRSAPIKNVKNDSRLSKNKKTQKDQKITGRASDENVDQKFADFITKDWSNCEKSYENGLICYECDDKKGTHKECMFVSSNNPNESHSGYSKMYKYATGKHGGDSDSTRRNGKVSMFNKRKTPKNNPKTIKPGQQQKEAEIIYGQPYEYVRPYTEDLSKNDNGGKHILKRMEKRANV